MNAPDHDPLPLSACTIRRRGDVIAPLHGAARIAGIDAL
jgi:hypothetical protein